VRFLSQAMCGFAGLLTREALSGEELAGHACRMIAPLAHRGPDDSGVWVDEHAGAALGFRRLAVVDLSPHGRQPMASPSGRFIAVFNGEVYNAVELRNELEPHGYRFRGHSDTEVILAAFERWGIRAAVRRFVGMFAMAVWDAHRRELSLLRDRLGKKPLYVYSEPNLITFGSELKALVAGPSFDRAIDREALAAFFRYLYVPAPRSIFARAAKVPAAHILTIADPALPLPAAHPYWSLRETALEGLANPITSETEAVDRLDALLLDAVSCRMRADVPIGALLSGGVDSSTVVALMCEASSRPVRTYAIGFDDRQFDESRHAAAVARHLGTDHNGLTVTGDDVQALIPRMPDIFDEPFADPSQLPTVLVSELARRHVTVALSGDGGDELFGGYNRYVYGARVLPRIESVPVGLRRRVAARLASVAPATWDRLSIVAALVPGLPDQRLGERIHKLGEIMAAASPAGMYRSLLSAWQQPEALVRDASGGNDQSADVLEWKELPDLVDRMMLSDQMTYLPDDLLAKLDRASMAVSLEVRAPLLDHRVVELSWRLPHRLKLRGSVGKWILRQVLFRRVPRRLIDRPKMGFSVPIDRWLRGPLRKWAGGLLASDELGRDGVLDPEPVRRAWQDLQDGRRQSGTALWAAIMFQAWRARWAA
jgi:asparagine synthase (glutamine-hydrolysing)